MTKNQLKGKKILVTGGAGFIGSNLVEFLLSAGASVSVLDSLETGKRKNIEAFLNHPDFTFIEGDIRFVEDCMKAVEGIELITHQAALGSVPRSIEFPHATHATNTTGFLNMLQAACEKGVKRFVYASSSSVYGDSTVSPKTIGSEGNLLSPYAVTKSLNELYAGVYHRLHGMETIGLRYFNVFGPKQDPNGVYAAAIPKFIDKLIKGEEVTIHGDGNQTRDFTYVANAVKANFLALTTTNSQAFGSVFNVACGKYLSLNDVIESLRKNLAEKGLLHPDSKVVNGPERAGDIRNSLADITTTKDQLQYEGLIDFDEGIRQLINSVIVNR
ncbi:SDR family NAD(P)-dependent oxidoreductase [Crocinitomicaceae bacterium CZZ-1]|uniref:SDR family NAD(P)-dependent oxidoreductase n=1 Tax=Taishania pollutisoli TaxID=2766479 RepID=A0A8J6PE07_9FLAO|nr:NAD-dependent epimerase/dehydratase family protein [Taishania pollutisoli]MBC9811960.1 SDR family NAD(P)-dependent oxidoreductase [Taishania pollutisoli]MBX2949964.1 SDR family NAD(P)-dependent oxidoreductase [Crocinitomicaceae bacterium]NGF74883.1 SDR family NAD(P)-dependent oxidoreductase [Fluviicola sp. SGL-29]